MKKKFIKTPLKGVYVHGAKDVGTRTVNLLMGEHAGEYVRGDIMDANAVIQAFDELKGNVDNNHDSLEEIVNEIHNFRDTTNHRFDVFQEKAEEETANRIQGDNTLDDKIDQKEIESNERDNVLQQNIDTEKQERVNADTQLRNDLTAEVNRAKASENALSSDIQAEATKRENDDNTIKDNLNAEITRATAKENEIKAEVDIINGDSTTEGSFRKAIADVVGAAPEAYDTLKEIADKLNSNDDLHAAINDAIATKATTVALNEEIARAKAAEEQNKADIAAESARAKEVEGDNALAIQNEASRATTAETAINESLNTEIDRAKGQEVYLQNLVNAKADTTALDGAKAELEKKISDETTRATTKEDELRSLITTEQNRATASENSIADDLNGKLAQKADTTALNNYVLTTTLTEYAKKTDIPEAATKESIGVVKVGDGLNVTDGTISVDPEYLVDMMSYGVEWDTTVADPACTRIGNPLYHKQLPIQSQYKGCVVKNGVVNYYLDPNDWSNKADGTPSVLDGTDGDVMVHIPKFYGKSGSNGNKRWVRIATKKIDSSWVEIPEMFVSAYRITTYTDTDKTKVASVVNTTANYRGGSNRSDNDQYLDTDKFRTDLGKPITNVSRSTMRTNANNSGQELLCYEYYKWVFYWTYVIEYANFNLQKEFNSELTSDGCHQGGLGSGVTNWDYADWFRYNGLDPITPCGYTNEFGNFSGVKQILIPQTQINGSTTINEKTLYANRWRGFENPFGDIWTNLDGIVLKRDSANAESKVYTTSDSSKFGDDTSVMNVAGVEVATDGYTKEFDLRETGEIIPQLVGGSESTYKCDYHWCDEQSTNKRTLLVGGLAIHGGEAGLGAFYSNNGVDLAHSFVGFRSVVRA